MSRSPRPSVARARPRPARSPVAVAVLALLVAASAGGCGSRARPRVAVLGDSITVLTTAAIQRDLADSGYEASIRARNGATAADLSGDARDLRGEVPKQVIVNLGTNDVMHRVPPEQTSATLTELVEEFPIGTCVHLVTINEAVFSPTDPELGDRIRRLNDRIRLLAGRHGADVIDWSGLVTAYLAAHEPDGPLTSDTVHPTGVGQAKLAEAYRRAVTSCHP